MAKKSGDAASEDLIGDGAADDNDLLEGTASAKKSAAKKKAGATKAPAKKAPAKTAVKPAAKKTAKAPAAKSARGEGKFYFDPDEKEALAKKISISKKPMTTKDAAEKFEVETFKARLAMVHAVNVLEKGSLEKTGSVMTWTP